jgi:DNA-binding SARP family transcriptional activator
MPSSLQIILLGRPTISVGEHPVFQESHTKAQALLYYLAATRRTHYRNELASLFWPDMPDVQALKNLRNILPVLRNRVGAHVVITRHTVTFNRYTSYWLDVEAFEALLGIDPSQASTAALWEAVGLYGDDFLSGFYVRNAPLFEEWMLLKRERLRDLFIDVLQILANRHLHQQDYHAALNATRRLLSVAPWHEIGHQQQMQALSGLGQRSAALAQYQICCRILDTEFQVMPNDETTRIYEQIKADTLSPAANTHAFESVAPDLPHHASAPVKTGSFSTAACTSTSSFRASSLPVAVSNDGRILAVSNTHHTILLENLTTGKRLHRLSGHTATVTAVTFSPDGHSLASASTDQTVRLWDIASGTLRVTLTGHTAPINAISFSPDGRSLASASTDQTVRLWDTTSGALSSVLQAHQHPVAHVVFVPDGMRLVSIDINNVVLHWNLMAHHNTPVHLHALPVYG